MVTGFQWLYIYYIIIYNMDRYMAIKNMIFDL